MPELPDVEVLKFYFQTTSVDQEISTVRERGESLLSDIEFADFKDQVEGQSFERVERRGKFLIVHFHNFDKKLVLHFGMTGDLHYTRSEESFKDKDEHTKMIFDFDNDFELRIISVRKLGHIYLVSDVGDVDLLEEMGPEPLEIDKGDFLNLLQKYSRKKIKTFLMDQRVIPGIGNIYSDEILFRSGIQPERKVRSLSTKERKTLFKAMSSVLSEAIDYTKKGQFPDQWLASHRQDMVCPNDEEHHLNKELVGGRAAIFCPFCQN